MDELQAINQTYAVFSQIRGQGLLIGAQLAPLYAGKAKELLALASKHGLMMLNAGADVIRFTPIADYYPRRVTRGHECVTKSA